MEAEEELLQFDSCIGLAFFQLLTLQIAILGTSNVPGKGAAKASV